ncbi:MAG: MarR family transcriptional regulator [Candidatus Acidiferrales bacterium]|jgi:DNA-binding MarR family transcriptional regulator
MSSRATGSRKATATRAATPAHAASLEQQVFLDLLRLNGALVRDAEEILKPFDLSNSQFNVLRILRGAGAAGLACGEVGGRMITHDPDITRLLDRLETRGLIARERQQEDRRVVKTRITAEGLQVLSELDAPLCALHKRQFAAIPADQLGELAKLLANLRAKWELPACTKAAGSSKAGA